jgi:hypothetical protein
MAGVVFVVNPAGYKAAFKSWTGSPVGTYMKKKNLQVKTHAMALAPGPHTPPKNTTGIVYGKGALGASIITTQHNAPSGDLEGHVVAKAKHALWVHNGTNGPYVIKPKRPGGMLKFFWARKGTTVVLPRVTHPGIKIAQPFLADALSKSI